MPVFQGEMVRTLIAIKELSASVVPPNSGAFRYANMPNQAAAKRFHERLRAGGVITLERSSFPTAKPRSISIVETAYTIRHALHRFFHLAIAAFRADSVRSLGVSASFLALPPFLPKATAALFFILLLYCVPLRMSMEVCHRTL
jgi:hypothetical protein